MEGRGGDAAGPPTARGTGKRSPRSLRSQAEACWDILSFSAAGFAASYDSCNYWTETTDVFRDQFSFSFAHDRNHQIPKHLDHEWSRVPEWLLRFRWVSETLWKEGPAPKLFLDR